MNKLEKLGLALGALLFAGAWGLILLPSDSQAYLQNPVQDIDSPERNAEYLIVYNEDNVAHEVGDVVIFASTATDGANGLSITTTTTQGDLQVAGVVAKNDIAAGSWGMIQIRGYNDAVNITGNSTVGGALITSTTGEVAISTAAVASTPNYAPAVFGVCLTAESDGSCRAILY